jgi:hypothetical protein
VDEMANYIIFDADGKYENIIICEENDILPDGYTKQLLPSGYEWDGQQIVRNKYISLNLETI